ncbi:DsbA family protein [Paraburkholderia sp. SIMBA_054]|uniref:DsbA family protein n=1 Tax=Paraburkholderia sp. SIMBA_054 TaxID=3085795 RepID=UPI003979420D
MKLLSKYTVVKLSVIAVLSVCVAGWMLYRVASANEHYGPTPEGFAVMETAPAVPVVKDGAVELVEYYFFDCPHCMSFDPALQAAIEAEGNAVHVRRIPVGSGDLLTRHAALYYALAQMGKAEGLRHEIYATLQADGHALDTDEKTIAWVKAQGIDGAEFERVYHSAAVKDAIAAGHAEMVRAGITTVPTLVVGGKWVVSPTTAGGETRALEVMKGRIEAARLSPGA